METNSLWGRGLDEYAGSYTFDAALHKHIFGSDSENALRTEGVKNIHRICKLVAIGKEWPDSSIPVHLIKTSMLQSVLDLSLSPHTLHLLAVPALIGGCIRLMSTVKPFGEPSVSIGRKVFPLTS